MNKQILIMVMLCLVACKTRQVSNGKTSITDKSVKTETQKNITLRIDTGKTTSHLISKKLQSDSVQIEITPDTGVIQITNGNYIGKARNIIIRGTTTSSLVTDNLIQQKKGETAQATLSDSIAQQNNIQAQIKTKKIASTGLSNSMYWAAGLLLLIYCVLKINKFK